MIDSVDVKSLRSRLGWSQRRLAERLGVHHTTVSRMEAGQKPHGSTMKILRELAAQPAARAPSDEAGE